MPVSIQEATLTLETQSAEPIPLGKSESDRISYPYLRLKPTGQSHNKEFAVLVLENGLIRAVVCPDLGGRIVELTDLRTNTPIIPSPKKLNLFSGGRQGLEWHHGIDWVFGKNARADLLGKVQCLIKRPAENEDSGTVIIGGLTSDCDWHVMMTLEADSAELVLDARFHNRTHSATSGIFGFRSFGITGEGRLLSDELAALHGQDSDGGFLVSWQKGMIESIQFMEESVQITSVADGFLPPRATQSLQFRISPFSCLGVPTFAGSGIVGSVSDTRLKILSSKTEPQCKTIIACEGNTFESTNDLSCSTLSDSDISSLPPLTGLVIKGKSGVELLRWSADDQPKTTPSNSLQRGIADSVAQQLSRASEELLNSHHAGIEPNTCSLRRIPGAEATAYWLDALSSIKKEDWHSADQALEQAIGFAAEDQLLWWLKAAVQREGGLQSGESEERLNAHFLTPLEPALRAEAFLSMPHGESSEPNPILRPLSELHDSACSIINLYWECGLIKSTTRLADEILRFGEIPLIRYMLACVLLEHSRMDATAGEHIVAAQRVGVVPPFPHRRMERRAIKILSERFPSDPVLQQYNSLVEQFPV